MGLFFFWLENLILPMDDESVLLGLRRVVLVTMYLRVFLKDSSLKLFTWFGNE